MVFFNSGYVYMEINVDKIPYLGFIIKLLKSDY